MNDLQTLNVLLVEDDEDDYFLTHEMLNETQGMKIKIDWASTYDGGKEALLKPGYDAVLVDYDLGAHTGIELIRQSVRNGYPAPFILYTGRGSYAVDVEAMQAGASLYITKSESNPLLLERAIRYAMERKQSEVALQQANEELYWVNQELKKELVERKRMELAMEFQRQELEIKNKELINRNETLAILSDAAAELLAGADPITRLESLYKRVAKRLGLEIYIQYNLAQDESHLELGSLSGFPDKFLPTLQRLELGQAVCGTVAKTRQPMVVNNVQESRDEITNLIRSMGIKAYACHPLIVQNRMIGTLSFGSRSRTSFDPDSVALLRTICNLVATAMDRKRGEKELREIVEHMPH